MANDVWVSSPGLRTRSQVWTTIGMWAWVLHRFTGLGLVFYIFIHTALMSVALLLGQKAFDAMLSVLMGHPIFQFLEAILLAAVLYHGFNGIRILLFDLGVGIEVRSQKIMFWVSMAIAAILWLWYIALRL